MVLDILPLFGVGPLRFGSTREAVHEALGAPQGDTWDPVPGKTPVGDAWCDGRFQVHYKGTPAAVCSVEMTLDPRFAPRLYGSMVFAVPATVLLDRLAAHTRLTHELAPIGDGDPQMCVFSALGLVLSRNWGDDAYFSRVCVGGLARHLSDTPLGPSRHP